MGNLADKIKQQEQEAREQGIASSGGGWAKLTEGDNRFRILSEPEMIFEKYKVGICYTDCGYEGAAKMLMYVLDRKDNKIKLWKAPYMVGTTIAGYETDEEYAFSDYPMPYDIKVNAKGAGTKEVEYTVVPGRANSAVPADILAELAKKSPVAEVITKMKENKKAEHVADGSFAANQERKQKLADEINDAQQNATPSNYPTEDINPDDIPF